MALSHVSLHSTKWILAREEHDKICPEVKRTCFRLPRVSSGEASSFRSASIHHGKATIEWKWWYGISGEETV